MQGTMPGARRRGRPRTAWMDNIKTWTGLPLEESVRMTEDRDKWRRVWPTLGRGRLKEHSRTKSPLGRRKRQKTAANIHKTGSRLINIVVRRRLSQGHMQCIVCCLSVVKFGHMVLEICEWTDRNADRNTSPPSDSDCTASLWVT